MTNDVEAVALACPADERAFSYRKPRDSFSAMDMAC